MVHDEMYRRTACATSKALADVLGGRDIEGGAFVCMEGA